VDGDAAHVLTHDLALTHMEAGANINSERAYFLSYGTSAAHAARGTIEGGQNAIASALYLMAAKPRQIALYESVMTVKKIAPAAIAECG
jgi:hypothetical protein